MTDDSGKIRISNADRDDAIERLQLALDEGRIELAEFDSRTQAVYAAKTGTELEILFEDLPANRADDRSVHTIDLTDSERAEREAAVQRRVHGGHGHGGHGFGRFPALRTLLVVGGICVAIWAATSIGSGELRYFWPIWPILFISIPLVVQLASKRRDG